jgi:hypothetical protein
MAVTHRPHLDQAPTHPGGRPWRSEREYWGYGVWLFMGAVIAVAELWAVAGSPWWPTLSGTVGHLEQLWTPVKIIVVAMIAAGAGQMLSHPPRQQEFAPPGRRPHWRTNSGRLTRAEGGRTAELGHALWYFPVAVILIAAAAAAAAGLNSSRLVAGYVIYGLIAVAFLIIPNVLAFWFAREVPFPTLFRTLENLDTRWHPAVLIIVAGLSVLAIHLVAYPWP